MEGKSSEPLLLSPLIKAGKIVEAKALAKVVSLPGISELESYSGFITVDNKHNSNIFFWFFPAQNDYAHAPVHLWNEGGPAESSLFSILALLLGPIQADTDGKFTLRENSFAKDQSLIFFDSLFGAGYSFTNDDAGMTTTSEENAKHVYEFIRQFFLMFPELNKSKFFVGGGSYGAHLAPPLGKLILEKNQDKSGIQINLTKVFLYCPWTDPINQMEYSSFLFHLGLIDENTSKTFKEHENQIRKLILQKDYVKAKSIWEMLLFDPKPSKFSTVTGFLHPSNALESKTSFFDSFGYLVAIGQNPEVRQALHVGNGPFEFLSMKAIGALANDFMASVKEDVEYILTEGVPVNIITGQMDLTVTHIGVQKMISNFNWKGKEEFESSEREIWTVGGQVAGYKKAGGNLTYVLLRNSGHILFRDQMEWNDELMKQLNS